MDIQRFFENFSDLTTSNIQSVLVGGDGEYNFSSVILTIIAVSVVIIVLLKIYKHFYSSTSSEGFDVMNSNNGIMSPTQFQMKFRDGRYEGFDNNMPDEQIKKLLTAKHILEQKGNSMTLDELTKLRIINSEIEKMTQRHHNDNNNDDVKKLKRKNNENFKSDYNVELINNKIELVNEIADSLDIKLKKKQCKKIANYAIDNDLDDVKLKLYIRKNYGDDEDNENNEDNEDNGNDGDDEDNENFNIEGFNVEGFEGGNFLTANQMDDISSGAFNIDNYETMAPIVIGKKKNQ